MTQDSAALGDDRPVPLRAGEALDGAVVVVTGGGNGIGAAICGRMADAGARVIVADISADDAQRTASAIGPSATAVTVDVASADAARELVGDTAASYGRVDVLVNNAGIAPVEPLDNLTLTAWQRTFAVNVEGPLVLMQAAAQVMLAQEPLRRTGCRGKLITISSPAAQHGRPMVPAYGASKAALNHLSWSAAATWGPAGISTTVVYPGDVEGGMWPRLGTRIAELQGRTADEVISERLATSPSGRFQQPGEVADVVLFVAGYSGLDLNGRTIWTHQHVEGP
jgi:meso-butanediol dehydrogenase/(S,S)-butanediol dehydrogenase/diacetyl reductase